MFETNAAVANGFKGLAEKSMHTLINSSTSTALNYAWIKDRFIDNDFIMGKWFSRI